LYNPGAPAKDAEPAEPPIAAPVPIAPARGVQIVEQSFSVSSPRDEMSELVRELIDVLAEQNRRSETMTELFGQLLGEIRTMNARHAPESPEPERPSPRPAPPVDVAELHRRAQMIERLIKPREGSNAAATDASNDLAWWTERIGDVAEDKPNLLARLKSLLNKPGTS
jgi:hypothetical protein